MGDFEQSLPPEERPKVDVLLAALEPFAILRGTMPLQYVRAFLLVAREEGLGVGDYADRAGVAQSVMTRHLRHLSDLGPSNRHHEEGFGLITSQPDPMNRRKHQVSLTPKGKALWHRIGRALAVLEK